MANEKKQIQTPTNQTIQNNTLLQSNSDVLSQVLSSSNSDFTLKTGSIDFDTALKFDKGQLSGVRDFDYEIFDLRPTVPQVLFEVPARNQKLEGPEPVALEKEAPRLEQDKPGLNANLEQNMAKLDLALEQPMLEQNLEQLKEAPLMIESPVAPRNLQKAKTETKLEEAKQPVKQKTA